MERYLSILQQNSHPDSLLTKLRIMKRMKLLLPVAVLLAFTVISPIDEVVQAFKSANISQVSKFFDQTVEISMPDQSNSYSRAQAETVLRDFYSLHGIRGFSLLHKGETAGSEYFIGQYQSKTGAYRVTVFLNSKDRKLLIQQIRFERE